MDSHYKEKTFSRQSYLYNGNLHTWKDWLYIQTGPAIPPDDWNVQWVIFNILMPKQNGYQLAHDIFKGIFFNENMFVFPDPIHNKTALV